jgi:hypothetical protein
MCNRSHSNLPEALDAKLARLAKARKQTKSEIDHEAIEAMVDGGQPKRPVTMTELAGDLLGCLEDPGDLSTNPKHMEGFGK